MSSPTTQVAVHATSESIVPARVPYGTCVRRRTGRTLRGRHRSAAQRVRPAARAGRDRRAAHRHRGGDVDRQRPAPPARALGGSGIGSRERRGRGRLVIVLAGFVLASAGMALFASPVVAGTTGLIAAMVVLYTGINVQRAPFQALVADLVPSRYRSFATGSVTFQMCVGAIVFLMLGQMLGMRPAFLIAAGTVLAIAAAVCLQPSGAGRAALARRGRHLPLTLRCGVDRRARRGSRGCGRSSWRRSCCS